MGVENFINNISRKVHSFFALFNAENFSSFGNRALNSDFFRFFSSGLILVLFAAPISLAPLDLYKNVGDEALAWIFAFRLPFDHNLNLGFSALRFLLWLIYLLPLASVFSFVSYFLEKYRGFKLKNLSIIFCFVAFSAYIFCAAVCLVLNANSGAWFSKVPFYIYLAFALALVEHVLLTFYEILYHRSINPEYVEYRKVRKEFSQKKHRLSIKRKFTFVIMGLISVILISFMLLILNSYKRMFTEAVSDVGRAQAEHTADIYDSADGEYEKIAAFFKEQGESNKFADTPFERIDIIITYDKDSVYLENW